MVLEGERTVASVAREFGINAGTLGSWVKLFENAPDLRLWAARAGAARSGAAPQDQCRPRFTAISWSMRVIGV